MVNVSPGSKTFMGTLGGVRMRGVVNWLADDMSVMQRELEMEPIRKVVLPGGHNWQSLWGNWSRYIPQGHGRQPDRRPQPGSYHSAHSVPRGQETPGDQKQILIGRPYIRLYTNTYGFKFI